MIDPLPKQVLCPGSESAPKRQRLLWQSDRIKLFEARRAKFFAGKVPNSPFRQACLKTERELPARACRKWDFPISFLRRTVGASVICPFLSCGKTTCRCGLRTRDAGLRTRDRSNIKDRFVKNEGLRTRDRSNMVHDDEEAGSLGWPKLE
jgi:hypothetical protein